MTTTEVRDVFATLRPVLTELVRGAPQVDATILKGDFDPQRQRSFCEAVLATLGFDPGVWRLDPTAHPFCTSFSNRDIRLTTRYSEHNLEAIWSTMHEAGHGLYAAGIADATSGAPSRARRRTASTIAQSRTWENLVGRSRPFWEHWYGTLQETFPALADVELDAFVRAINRAEPGLIRVDADETTYSLHIILRFELEQAMLEGSLPLEDLPEAWRAGMRHARRRGARRCERRPAGRALVVRELRLLPHLRPGQRRLAADLGQGAGGPARSGRADEKRASWASWSMRENLYAWGRKLTPRETLRRVTGNDTIDPQPYLEYLRTKLATLAA